MSLIDAYDLIEKAEICLRRNQLREAKTHFTEGIEIFKSNLSKTSNKEIQNGLHLLISEYSNKLKDLDELSLTNSTSSSTSINSQLSLNQLRAGRAVSNDLSTKRGLTNLKENDPLMKFQLNISTLINKQLDLNEVTNYNNDPALSKAIENTTTLNNHIKQINSTLINQINLLKRDLNQKELALKTDYESRLESLISENNRLKNQIQKLNKRWNELVESAKRRRNDQQLKPNTDDS